jgi:gliding motility-associated protein GldM
MKKIVLILALAFSIPATAQNVKNAVFNVSKANKTIAVSPTKMAVFYIGIDNPIDIAICDMPAKYITATVDSGEVENKGDGQFVVRINKVITATKVNIFESYNGKTTKIGERAFRVKKVPDPYPTIGGIQSGIISKGVLMASGFLAAKTDNFDFDITFKIISFTFYVNVKGDLIEESCTSGNMLTASMLSKISRATSGTKIYFEDIKAVGPDGIIRTLSPINIKVI